jgi:lactate permease
MVSWSETLEVLPAILVVGISFAGMQYFWSNHVDSNLVDIAAGIFSMLATLAFLRVWRPKRIWRFPEEREGPPSPRGKQPEVIHAATGDEWQIGSDPSFERRPGCSGAQIAKAWMPFAILSVFVLCWGLPSIKIAMGRATTPAFAEGGWNVPYLHKAVLRAQPVVAIPTPENAKFDFNWLTATGTACFLAALLAGTLLGLRPRAMLRIFGKTLYRMRLAIVAMACMLGLGYVTRYSGMDAVLGLAFTRTGWLFPFFGTYIGWLGVALTGSDTSSNALFGGLQRITAEQLHLNPVLMCSANSAGGVMGKMIDAQSICIATAATNQVGSEGSIFRFVFWHSVALAAIVGLIVMLYAYVFPHAIP